MVMAAGWGGEADPHGVAALDPQVRWQPRPLPPLQEGGELAQAGQRARATPEGSVARRMPRARRISAMAWLVVASMAATASRTRVGSGSVSGTSRAASAWTRSR
jgi:hypothetical protein